MSVAIGIIVAPIIGLIGDGTLDARFSFVWTVGLC